MCDEERTRLFRCIVTTSGGVGFVREAKKEANNRNAKECEEEEEEEEEEEGEEDENSSVNPYKLGPSEESEDEVSVDETPEVFVKVNTPIPVMRTQKEAFPAKSKSPTKPKPKTPPKESSYQIIKGAYDNHDSGCLCCTNCC
ncbi:hypothetical protein RYX36_022458 [Vicia faba]